MTSARRIASVDIGSNSVLMLVAEHRDGVWQRIDDLVDIARISEGLDASGVLAPHAVARAAAVLARYAARARDLGVDRIVATGTAPFRRARNGAQVAAELSAVLGAPIDVVSGEHEASLSLLATRRAFPELDAMLVVDIGGASTEVIAVRGDASPQMVSVDVGSVRLAERCISSDPISADDETRLVATIDQALDDAGASALLARGGAIVGIAGTVTTLATASLAMDAWDPDVVHGHRIPRAELDRLARALLEATTAERAAMRGVEPKRADVIPAGAVLMRCIAEKAGATEVIVSDRGTRWGRLYEVADAE